MESVLSEHGPTLQKNLDAAYARMDRLQPALAAYCAEEVSEAQGDLAQSVGYFLVVSVFMAFEEAFAGRLHSMHSTDVKTLSDLITTDESLHSAEESATEDWVHLAQPSVMAFVDHHLRSAFAGIEGADAETPASPSTDEAQLARIYRAVLLETFALSECVLAPEGTARQLPS